MKSEKIKENTKDFFNTFKPFICNITAENNTINLNIDGNVTENDAVAVANCFAEYFANVALNIGGQHVHDLLEEDHQYHAGSIESLTRKHHDAALDFNFQATTEKVVLLRAPGLRSGKWGNGHPYLKVFEHLLCKQITTYYDRILYSRMTA